MITLVAAPEDSTRARTFADRFELKSQAGTGGMGTVYQALDRETNTVVAVKILHGKGAMDAARFGQEAALLAELRHPGIVRYVDHGVTDHGDPYIAMEWLSGETLEERLLRGPLTAVAAAHLAGKMMAALAAAHRRGIIHRDIKPSNIYLVGWSLTDIRLLDFGIARRVFDPKRFTKVGSTVGTPMYTAPEQARGDRDVDARADIFSMGCVLYECVAGEPPFSGESPMEVMAKICMGTVPKVATTCAHLPPELIALIDSMLTQDRAKRPGDAAALADAFIALAPSLGTLEEQAAPQRPATTTRETLTDIEQRMMSALLVTGRAGSLAPEDRLPPRRSPWEKATAVIAAAPGGEGLRGLVAKIVEPLGGQVDQLVDDSLLVTAPGQPTLREQAVRLARAALAIKHRLPTASMSLATGRAALLAKLPVGPLVERAAALLPSDVGAVQLDENTSRLLPSRFRQTPNVDGARLIGDGDAEEQPRQVGGKEAPFLGREREMGALLSLYRHAAEEGVARAALVLAPSGSGKTRLRQELARVLARESVPPQIFLGVGSLVRSAARFPLLGPLLVAAQMAGDKPGAPAPTPEGLTGWLRAECEKAPVVLILDDLQWADLGSVQMIDAALRALRDQPFVVVALGRPEVDDQFPGLWAERAVERLRLPPLGRKTAQALIKHWLPNIDTDAEAAMLERCDGNPFLLEELVSAALAGRNVTPDLVLAAVEARLDLLPAEVRRFLRAASVFGDQAFSADGVLAVVGDKHRRELLEALDILSTRDFLQRMGAGDEVTYRFRQRIVREAAYKMVPPGERVMARRLARAFLENSGKTLPDFLTLPLSQSAGFAAFGG